MAQTCNFVQKEALAQVFSYEFCEISKNTFLYRTPLVATSEDMLQEKGCSSQSKKLKFFIVKYYDISKIC